MDIREGILIIAVIVLCLVGFWAKKLFARKIEQSRKNGKHVLDSYTLEILQRIFTILIFLIGSMLVLQLLGIDIVPILTLSGVGAAILGFACRDVFANFFGGMMVYMTRPFVVNDFIELPDKKISGTVEEIGWYLTTIRDSQKRCLYVPNALFSTEYLLNGSRMTHRRIDEKLRFRITDGEKAHCLIEQIREMIKHHPEIDHREQVDVFLLYIGPWGVEIDVKAYTKTTHYLKFMEVKQGILLNISKMANQAGDVRT